jgi:hypothetical protein
MLVEIGTMRRTGGGRNQEERRETWSEEMGSGGGEEGGGGRLGKFQICIELGRYGVDLFEMEW